MTSTQRILISGGAGFIGTRLVGRLGDDAEVMLLDNLHPQVHGDSGWPEPAHGRVVQVTADVRDEDAWVSSISSFQPEIIVHLAAETGTGQSLTEAARHTSVNALGTARLLDALSKTGHRPDHIAVASSRAVYGEGAWETDSGTMFYPRGRTAADLDNRLWSPRGPAGEVGSPVPHAAGTTQPRPTNIYAATKLTQEHLLTSWGTSMGVSTSILRLQNVYGAGQALENSYTGVLTYFARCALAGREIEVYEGGGILRDFVHVSDVADAIAAAISSVPASGSRTVDIGSGSPGTLIEFAEVLAAAAGAPAPRVTDAYRLGDVRAASADVRAAHQDFGYVPKTSFDVGVKELLSWAESELSRA